MVNEQDWNQEQERLSKVKGQLQERIAELEPEVDGLQNQAGEIRKRFWEEVTVNTASDEDFEETFHSIKQQEALLSERERSYRLKLQQWKNLQRLLPSPYFGRIDFTENGLGIKEQVYIGVSSFVDSEGLNFLIYDWRTPIASMYYDYSPGPAAYDTPGGRVEGVMELKRQYQIRNGRLQNVFDTSLTIGDELLQQVLGKGADSQMRSIVATIQKEQNAIIRDDQSRMLIVQGAAGSGKTSAALQRVAYLLYKDRERLKADQVVLFSPNPMFNSYVSTVLPELGEENMQQATFQEYLEYGLGAALRLEDPFDQIEYVLTEQSTREYEARLKGIEYKASASFLQALQNYAGWLGQEGMRFNGIRFRDRDLITAEQMEAQFYSYDPSIRLAVRVGMLQEWLLKELTLLERKERTELWVQEELNYLDNEQYAAVHKELHKERGVFDFAEKYEEIQEFLQNKPRRDEGDFDYAEREEELLSRQIVKEQFKPLRRSVKKMRIIDMAGLYAQLFGSPDVYAAMTKEKHIPKHWAEVCEQTREKLSRLELFYEDATPFLYLKELVEGVRINTQVKHVFVDEGQDYSMFQYEFLKKLFPRARMTVLGDFGQAIFTQATELYGADSPLIGLYGEPDTRLIRLVRSYRSTREIVEFTRSMLPGGQEIVPFDRSGGKPLLTQAASKGQLAAQIAEDVAVLQAEGFASIAVITKTAAESIEAHDLLTAHGGAQLRLITKETPTFENGAVVIPAYLAKGVEFDAVLIYDSSADVYHRESERKLFYTACTRAMHRLQLYAAGAWTPFIKAVDASLYEVKELRD
ncbi:RNA polymerase recycling motor HelD [Paenibacillus physcomitrellae]|uniref:DNA helicase n=1 Tax=Paenibacillus physcomitrellae TaxID=1619311 RepID=A0ABQ1G2C6_9BACL|nr:RNA polymerase recycling motor HelD [Paenibacillus physcomitrellae]GGA34204.1 DNA helicase [Paenibacillus physcomitrellae]